MARTADRAQSDGSAPKEVGRQLRHIRRKQGLSRSEVARSAGLTRRELAAYESGRAAVPESDLWCLAGSCGVDVAELLPDRAPVKVSSDLNLLAIGDSIRYLRDPVDDEMLREYLAMIYELRNLAPGSKIPLRERDLMSLADALGGSPERIEARLVELIGISREEAARLRSMIMPSNELSAGTIATGDVIGDVYFGLHAPNADAAVVDFFSTPRAPDVFEPPPPPGAQPATAGWTDTFSTPAAMPVEPVAPVAPIAPVDPMSSFDSMPISYGAPLPVIEPDTAMADPEPVMLEPEPVPKDPFAAPLPPVSYRPDAAIERDDTEEPTIFTDAVPAFAEEPPAPWPPSPPADAPEPISFVPTSVENAEIFTPGPFSEPPEDEWVDAEPLPRRQPLQAPLPDALDVIDVDEVPPAEFEPLGAPEPRVVLPEPPAVALAPPPVPAPPSPPAPPAAPPVAFVAPPVAAAVAAAPVIETPATGQPFVIPEVPLVPTPGVPPIAWMAHEQPAETASPGSGFQRAGSNWRVGGIFPATAMADDGALTLRRADARWALADLDAPGDFTVEAVVDFSAGAGFGILFRASVDEAERVSGYSFDIDPIAGGGGYLVRQWEDNRQHWRPIAQAGVTDPTLLFGRHTVWVSVRADQLSVIVDNDPVLTVPALSRCSIELGRPPCRGTRVGVQAWATTEVTIDSFQVARH